MDPIRRINELVALIKSDRSTGQSQRTKQKKTSPSTSNSSSARKTKKTLEPSGTTELKNRILERISALTPEQQKSERATQIFVESVLSWKFGNNLQNDPRFYAITQRIVEEFNNDQSLQQSIVNFINNK